MVEETTTATSKQQSMSSPSRRKVKPTGKSNRSSCHAPMRPGRREAQTPSPDSVTQASMLHETTGKTNPSTSRREELQTNSRNGMRKVARPKREDPATGSNTATGEQPEQQQQQQRLGSHSRKSSKDSSARKTTSSLSPTKRSKGKPIRSEKVPGPKAEAKVTKELMALCKAQESLRASQSSLGDESFHTAFPNSPSSTHNWSITSLYQLSSGSLRVSQGSFGGSFHTAASTSPSSTHNRSIASLYRQKPFDSNSPKQAHAQSHWLTERQIKKVDGCSSNATPVRQRSASFVFSPPPTPTAPPDSPLVGKASNMIHLHKLELNGKDRSGHGSDSNHSVGVDNAVRRRRRMHMEKCSRAAKAIQRMVRGWLVRNCSSPKMKRDQKNSRKSRSTNKEKESRNESRSRSLSPKRIPTTRSSSTLILLTPKVKGAETLAHRLNSSLHCSSLRLSYDSSLSDYSDSEEPEDMMFSSAKRQGGNRSTSSTALEEELQNIFLSNIAHVAARARSNHEQSKTGGRNDSNGNTRQQPSSSKDIGSLPL